MKESATLILLILGFIHQTASKIPSKENLCGLIVDQDLAAECLQCFTEAGNISKYPEEVRECVAIYLPPIAANCAVPHPQREMDRMQQGHPDVHHNHTNANLLPNCLKRRMRDLSRYLKKENTFTKEAGNIVKTVVMSNLIPVGGPNMLSLASQRYILEIPTVKLLVEASASDCLDDYDNSLALLERTFYKNVKQFEEEDDDDVNRKEVRFLQSADEWEDTNELQWRSTSSSIGNALPYGGTNSIAIEMILGKCIVNALIESNTVVQLISVITAEEFYYPIPSWWVEPLLHYYKTYRENLESGK